MLGLLILLFAIFFFGGIYCIFTDRFTLYCGGDDWWSLFFGVIFPGTLFFLNAGAELPLDSFFAGVPFALAAVTLLYNMYITFKKNMLEGRGVFFSFFAVCYKIFLLVLIAFVLLRIFKGKGKKKR